MSPPSIDTVAVKLLWAERHLNRLKAEVVEFAGEQPFEVVTECDTEARKDRFRLRQRIAPPPHWPMLVGDCAHNIRASLDYLAWNISFRPDEQTAFPIQEDRITVKGGVRKFGISGGAHPRALELVEGLQPYHRTDDPTLHPLWILNRLDVIDKHRTLNAVTMAVPMGKISWFVEGRPYSASMRTGPFEDGEEVAAVDHPIGHSVEVTADFTTSIELEVRRAGRDGEAIGLLTELLNFVRNSVVLPLRKYMRR